MIYLDNAATTYPKPECVYSAVDKVFRESSGNPGRSGHKLSLAADKVIDDARFIVSRFFGVTRPESLIFTFNTTDSLNLAIKGILTQGDHVITSSMEHNSVTRPLEMLKSKGVEYTKVQTDPAKGIDVDEINKAIKSNTKLVIINHVSNVTGTINSVEQIGELCREKGILFLVDAAQSAGIIPIDVNKMNIDMLAFPGHKGLMGPQGTGGLYIRKGIILNTLREGGTGSNSELLYQPDTLPDRYESGTPNIAGIAGLAAGVQYILDEGIENIRKKDTKLANKLLNALEDIPNITIYGPPACEERSGVVSLKIDGIEVSEIAAVLDNAFDIAVRAGLHCAPDAHKTLGTLEKGGTLRISAGYFNSEDDIDVCINTLQIIAKEYA